MLMLITNIKTILIVPKAHAFINIFLSNDFSFLFKKFFTYIKTKNFNLNKIIALFLSGFVILCMRYIFNCYNYPINISLLFIIFCGFLKPILLVIIEYMHETEIFTLKKKNMFNKYFFNNTFISNNNNNKNLINIKNNGYYIINNNNDINLIYYNVNIYDIHIPITLEKLKNASNLFEVDAFFKLIYTEEINRHDNKLKELIYEAVKTQILQKELINKIEEEYAIFKERLNIIEEDRCTHVVFLRVKKNLKY
jgi:hypothetical protein